MKFPWSTQPYLKLPSGNCYFVGIIDWYSRRILSHRISNSMDKQFCIDALNEALALYGKPEIFNSDQGAQFTSDDFTAILKNNKIKISMDSVGRWADNIIIERFFRTLKYEDFYILKYKTIKECKEGIKNYIQYYNFERKHSSLGYVTPNQMYYLDSLQVAA
ncbi:IS3 family transposase [bacterium]